MCRSGDEQKLAILRLVTGAVSPLIEVRDIKDAERDDCCSAPRLEAVFGHHDQPVVIRRVQKILKQHPRVLVVVCGILVAVREAVIPLGVQRHRPDDGIGDGLNVRSKT